MEARREDNPVTELLLLSLAAMAGIGIALGLVLAWGSRRFHVETDPRIGQIEEALPGINCGACGYAGCAGYAEAIVEEDEALNLCAPGGEEVAHAVARVMGREVEAAEPTKAVSCCQGGNVGWRFEYSGVQDCRAAHAPGIAGGPKLCSYGCLGFGTCAKACPFGAITMSAERMPVIDEELCTGCGRCVEACPRDLNRVDPESRTVFVLCKSHDKGAVANKVCDHGCIACRKCEKECPFDAIHVIDNLAVIDYDKCKLCGKCVKVCPKNCIVNLRQERRERKKRREAAAAAAPVAPKTDGDFAPAAAPEERT
jgi:Na+-translocating ferredoxin:NAD+ oxidoreductase RNF subunit RnfB